MSFFVFSGTRCSDRVDREALDACGDGLRVVSTMSVGVDHIDMDECQRRGVSVCGFFFCPLHSVCLVGSLTPFPSWRVQSSRPI